MRTTVFTEKLQLFMEYPHLVAGEHAEFLAHLTVLETGEPVRSGSLTFELTTPGGAVHALTWPAPQRDGLFVPELDFREAGSYALRLIVESPQVEDTIDVGEMIVHKSSHDASHAAEPGGREEPANLVPFLLEQQWKIGLRYEKAERRTLVQRLRLPGQIVAPQGASASVSPPVAGRLLRPPVGRLPRVGDKVEAGEVLALIEPPLFTRETAQLGANLAQVRLWETELTLGEVDIHAKTAEAERATTQAEARLAYARQVLSRTGDLHERGISSAERLEEAKQNARLAEAELAGAQALKRSYEEALERLGRLRQRSLPGAVEASEGVESHAVPLRAPIAGEVVSVAHIEGEHLDDAHQELFRIVNLDHVWVTAGISEFDLAALPDEPHATMTLFAYPDRRFDIMEAGGRLVHVGKVVDPATRTVSVTYEMPNPEGLLRIGSFAGGPPCRLYNTPARSFLRAKRAHRRIRRPRKNRVYGPKTPISSGSGTKRTRRAEKIFFCLRWSWQALTGAGGGGYEPRARATGRTDYVPGIRSARVRKSGHECNTAGIERMTSLHDSACTASLKPSNESVS